MEGRPLGKNELRAVQVASRRRRRIWFLKEELLLACRRRRRTLVGGGEPGSGARVTARGSKWRAAEEFESAKERKVLDLKRKFLEAALRYFDISQIEKRKIGDEAIDEEVLEQALSAAMTYTILAAAGP